MGTNYAVAPGMYLQEWLDDEQMTQQSLADRLGISRKTVNGILKGTQPISQDTAIKLERVTSIPRDSWIRFEAKYREDLARLEDELKMASSADIITPPLGKFLRDKGLTTATKRNPGKLVSDFLNVVGYGSMDAYAKGVDCVFSSIATLKEAGKPVDPASMMAWISLGENAEPSATDGAKAYDEASLKASLSSLKQRAATTDDMTLTDIALQLEQCGVTLQFISAPEQFPLHGITRWTKDGRPVIQMTGRRKKDGFIIWTLFHEIGHILNDGNVGITLSYIDEKQSSKSESEKRANAFAREVLMGPEGLSPYHDCKTSTKIQRIAQDRGDCPGVVVNLMHRKRMLDYSWCNDLLKDMTIPFKI